ncbi:hypothetical protein LVJ94_19555 [Pendulispora rubella]|uniref:Lipoprotein n=1 Tax=Pendulispora rubella TaxID=2741070 RepID=A0ABZ2LGA4_9BACT
MNRFLATTSLITFIASFACSNKEKATPQISVGELRPGQSYELTATDPIRCGQIRPAPLSDTKIEANVVGKDLRIKLDAFRATCGAAPAFTAGGGTTLLNELFVGYYPEGSPNLDCVCSGTLLVKGLPAGSHMLMVHAPDRQGKRTEFSQSIEIP